VDAGDRRPVSLERARDPRLAARGLPRPAAIEEFAWGRLGERLGEVFEARLGARSAARDGRVVAPAPAAEPPPARAASGRRS